MGTLTSLFVAGISVLYLAGCTATYPDSKVRSEVEMHEVVETNRLSVFPESQAEIERYAAEVTARRPEVERKLEKAAKRAESQQARVPQEKRKGALPAYEEYSVRAKIEKQRNEEPKKKVLVLEKAVAEAAAGELKALRLPAASRPEIPISAHQVSPEFGADEMLLARREAYLKELKQASYTFNPLSPIKVATPVIVYFWLDPLIEPMRLAEELKAKLMMMRPGETPQTMAGRIDWSPKMRATLTGEDFDITPTEAKNFDGLKNPSATRRTEWSWDVKAKHVGQQLPLHLRVWAVLPQELGEPYELLKLDKLIHVEVTFLWLVDEFWEKYWKGILGGLGTALAAAIGAWWKIRQPKAARF